MNVDTLKNRKLNEMLRLCFVGETTEIYWHCDLLTEAGEVIVTPSDRDQTGCGHNPTAITKQLRFLCAWTQTRHRCSIISPRTPDPF